MFLPSQINAVQQVFDEAEAAMGNGDLLNAIRLLDTLRGYPKTAVRCGGAKCCRLRTRLTWRGRPSTLHHIVVTSAVVLVESYLPVCCCALL
jgi:hypothetical protein